MTVLEVASNRILVKDVARYIGSTVGCRHPNLPSNCNQESITTWALARPACAAGCDATSNSYMTGSSEGPAPAIDVTCICR